VVVALGTGSVAMRLNEDGSEQMFGGWGFIAGDLGSGAFMGRLAVTRSLITWEQQKTSGDPLVELVLKQMGLKLGNEANTRQLVLDWLRDAGATDYAAIVPDIFKFETNSPLAQWIIQQATKSVEELIDTAQGKKPLKLALIGGLAQKLAGYLASKYQCQLIAAKGDAVDGGLFIGRQLASEIKQANKVG